MPSVHPRMLYLGALGLLVSVRLAPIVASDFPLGAGGLFVVMAHDLRETGFALPAFTSFNDGTIPFVYPPLGIYVLALIPGDPIETERWLPLIYSLASAGAAWLLARELGGSRIASVALLAFVAMPVTWAIEGGGVTRGLGFALLLLALWRIAVLLRAGGKLNAGMAGVVAGLAVLSHPSVGPTLGASAFLFLAARPSWRGTFLLSVAGRSGRADRPSLVAQRAGNARTGAADQWDNCAQHWFGGSAAAGVWTVMAWQPGSHPPSSAAGDGCCDSSP
jgi:uncharacterized membrane protein